MLAENYICCGCESIHRNVAYFYKTFLQNIKAKPMLLQY